MAKAASYSQWFLEPYCIGMKLRSLRTQKRLTLSRLAAETGLSTALLSKLETDRMVPTLATLATISRAYGVGLGHFFCEPSRHSVSITRKAHLQGSARGVDALKITPLHLVAEGQGMVAQMVEFPAGGAATAAASHSETRGLVYVLEGKLAMDAGGLHEVLEAGDCAWIESQMALAMSAAGKQRCRVLSVTPAAGRAEG
jgi:transcriptional regulator with XRE-family HTH domain